MPATLVITDRTTSFLAKYIGNFARELAELGSQLYTIAPAPYTGLHQDQIIQQLSTVPASGAEVERYMEAFAYARSQGITHLHIPFLNDAETLLKALSSSTNEFQITCSIFGLAAYLQKPFLYEQLIHHPVVRKVLIHSNAPEITRRTAHYFQILNASNVTYMHDPIYDEPGMYQAEQEVARRWLNLPLDLPIILYFGTYFHKKGADLLLDSLAEFSDRQDVCFVLAGSTATAPAGFDKAKYQQPNVIFDDRYIDEITAGQYFRAADLIVQPYRRLYEHDTSGVLVQSSLAQRPVLIPDISPFCETVQRFHLGLTFRCEDRHDLAHQIAHFLTHPMLPSDLGCREHLQYIESWAKITYYLLDLEEKELAV